MSRGKNRDPKIIAAELQARIDKIRAKEAMEEARKSPQLKPLVELLEDLKDQKTALSRKNSGPQSFENRLTKKQLWLNQIFAEQALNDAKIEDLGNRIEFLSDSLESFAVNLSNGQELSESALSDAQAQSQQSADLWDKEYNLEAATAARKDFGKKKDEDETEYEEADEMSAEA